MATRTFVLAASLGMILLLAFLTVKVAIDDGVTVLTIFSLALLALLGTGVLGALFEQGPPSDD
jgi:DMSO reductase anchor subunit